MMMKIAKFISNEIFVGQQVPQFHQRFTYKILSPKNLKGKTKLGNFWRKNFLPKTRA